MKFIMTGERIIQVDHITDVVTVPEDQGGGIHINFVGGSALRLSGEEQELGQNFWNWLAKGVTHIDPQPPNPLWSGTGVKGWEQD